MKYILILLISFYTLGSDSTGVNCVEPVNPPIDDETINNLSAIRSTLPKLSNKAVQGLCTQIKYCTGTPEVERVLLSFYEKHGISNDEFVKYYLYDLKCQYKQGCVDCRQPLLVYLIERNPGMFNCLMYNSGSMADHKEQMLIEREYGGKKQTLWDYIVNDLKPKYMKDKRMDIYKLIIRPLRTAKKF